MKNQKPEVTALAEVVRSVFADLERHGRVIGADAQAAVALVERWLTSEDGDVPGDELVGAAKRAHQDDVPAAQREQDRALDWANTAAGNLCYAAAKGRVTKESKRTTMEAALYALSSLRVEGVRDEGGLEALRADALARAEAAAKNVAPAKKTSKPSTSKAAPPKKPTKVKDELDAALGVVASERLRAVGAVFDPRKRMDGAALRKLLLARDYPAHAPVLAFEQRYGGLVAPDGPDEEGYDWTYGAGACVSSDAHADPRGAPGLRGDAALVPVAYSPNDVIYFLDGHGAAWVEDTIEGDLERFADDGDRMVARVLLQQVLFERRASELVLDVDGKRGEEAAALLGVPTIPEATDDRVHVWGDLHALVFEERRAQDAAANRGPWTTRISAADAKTLAAVRAKL